MTTDQTLARTPLYEEHLALGARMVPFAGFEMPVQYSGIIDEHVAVRQRAGIFDICHMSEFRFFGFGAKRALQRVVTNDLDKIDELGRAVYTVMCDEAGGIIDDLIVYHTGDLEYLVIANAATRAGDWEWMSSQMTGDVESVDESDRTGLIALQGPDAVRIIEEIAGADAPKRFRIAEASFDGVPVLLSRTGYTGEDGVEIVCHISQVVAIWRVLLSFAEVTPVGLGARDTLRLEMGYPLYGTDMDRTVDPISAGLGWVVALGKDGAFIGREAVAKVAEQGPARRLVGLIAGEGEGIARHGFPVLRDGEQVGSVASGTFSPTLGRGIATAYVPADMAEPGTPVRIAIRKRVASAEVVRMPFIAETSLTRK
jgi:aminomethyltransferase